MAAGKLKLRAHDPADLAVLSAHLQDALVPVADMAWLKEERRFVLLANRFCWERDAEQPLSDDAGEATGDAVFADTPDESDEKGFYSRTIAGLCIDRVNRVQVRNLDPRSRDRVLNLLALKPEEGAVRVIFAGGGEIRVEVARIAVHMEDLGERWPTHWRPSHD